MRIQDFMSKDVVTIAANATVAAAREKLRLQEVKHLVVMDGKRPVGVIARRDVAQADEHAPVSAVMTRDMVTIEPAATLRRAAGAMVGRGVGCLPVIEEGRLLGIVTTTDLLHAIAKGEIHASPPADRSVLRKRGDRKVTRRAI